MWRQICAIIFAFWPLPIGIGYLFLKRWRRFLVAFLGLQVIALTVWLMVFGSGTLFNLLTAAMFLGILADTWRLAITELTKQS